VEWIAANRWVDEMAAELRDVTRTARALTDIRPIRVPLAARCLMHRDGERCAGQVTIYVRGDDWTARCSSPECGDVQDATGYLKGNGVISGDGVMLLARRYGVPCSSDVLRQWKHRGKITGKLIGDVWWWDLKSTHDYLSRRAARERIAS
jgi:hypothetical protein